MEVARVEARAVTVLRMALWYAADSGYEGPGKDWHRLPAEGLAELILRGEHLAVLRSLEFAKKFRPWGVRLAADTFMGMTPPRNIAWNRWREHQVAIQSVDPLEYLDPFIG